MAEKITAAEAHERFRAQGVPREHIAFRCPMCSTVQSMASLRASGAPDERLETAIGFSCEGRFNGAGEWPSDPKKQAKRERRGCNWTLGGLFKIHKLEVECEDGTHPSFEIATPDEAKSLMAEMAEPATAT